MSVFTATQFLRVSCPVRIASGAKAASLIVLIVSFSPNAGAQFPLTDPGNRRGWRLNEAVSDEFDKPRIDTEKWVIQGADQRFENRFKGRAPSVFSPQNVAVVNGNLVITSRWQPDFKFPDEEFAGYRYANITTGAIVSRSEFRYGYLETRCRAADGPISSSFWTTGKGGELDVFEHYGHHPSKSGSGVRYQSSFHDWRTPGTPTYGTRIWTNEHQLPFRVADGFHVYGLEWDQNFIKIFVDGDLVRRVSKSEIGESWVVDHAQRVWFDSETFPWEVDPNSLKASDFPGEGRRFLVDYVRIWQTDSPGDIGVRRTNLLENSDFAKGLQSWHVSGNSKLIDEPSQSYLGRNHVRVVGGGDSAVEQTVAVKPDTSYLVSAWAKSPATNYDDVYDDAWLGVKNFDNGFQTVQYFKNFWHRKSIQFTTGANAKTVTVFFTNQWSDESALVDQIELVEISENPEPK